MPCPAIKINIINQHKIIQNDKTYSTSNRITAAFSNPDLVERQVSIKNASEYFDMKEQ